MEVYLVDVPDTNVLDLESFSKMTAVGVYYYNNERCRVNKLETCVLSKRIYGVDDFFNLLANNLETSILRYPVEGQVLIEITSIIKSLVPDKNKYSFVMTIKLYIAQ
nr:MAG TPA: hypothetical protein [Caudoviricetes sp.]